MCRWRRSSARSAPSSSDPSRKWKCINTQHSRSDRACTVKLIEPCCCKLIDYSDRISNLLWLEIRDNDTQRKAEKLNCANKKFILMSIPFNWSSAFVVFRLGTRSIWTSATHSRMWRRLSFWPVSVSTFPFFLQPEKPSSPSQQSRALSGHTSFFRGELNRLVVWRRSYFGGF